MSEPLPSENGGPFARMDIPAGASDVLFAGNPVLISLKQRYAGFDARVTTPLLWQPEYIDQQVEIMRFRGESAYIYQIRGMNTSVSAYAITTEYVKSIDTLGLLDRLFDDGLFGACLFQIAGKFVSRDLLDSIIELYFINRYLDIANRTDMHILDIGAGYGRLAYHTVTAFPGIKYFCTDAVALSSFISDFYLHFRGIQNQAKVIPLDEIEKILQSTQIDLAINIHSFPECQAEAIEWWLALISRHKVKYLMIVANLSNGGLYTHVGENMMMIFQRHGYQMLAREPKYPDLIVQQTGLQPTDYHLFELKI